MSDGGSSFGTRFQAHLRAFGKAWNERFTTGQQWTAGMLLVLATAVMSFGLPPNTVVRPQQAAGGAVRPAPVEAPEGEGDAPAAPAGGERDDRPGPAAGRGGEVALPVESSGGGADATSDTTTTTMPDGGGGADLGFVGPPQIVALVQTDSTLPGRDDAAIADAYLSRAKFDVEVVELSDDPALCQVVAAAGDVVLSSDGLPADLRDCLVTAGKLLVSHDALGDVPPAPGGGQVLSTRRASVDSLVDLGRWARGAGLLSAQSGLVVSERLQEEIEPAVEALRRIGVRFAEVFYVPDGPQAGLAMLGAVRDFDDAGVGTVLFAADVSDQRRWVELATASRVEFSYLVSDVADGVVVEDYPSSFAGTLAHTSFRTPWWERDEGETREQAACRQAWEDAAPPAPPGRAGELARAYVWCLHAWLLVEPALDAVDDGVPFDVAVRERVLASPLTTDLGSLAGGGWGPRQDHVLEWDGDDCGCWLHRSASHDRSPKA